MSIDNAIADLSLSGGEEDDWEVPAAAEAITWAYDLCLVGMVLTSSRVNFQALQDNCADLWQPQVGIAITDLGCRRYLFRFFHEVDIDRVMKRCPWDFNRHLLVLHRLQKDENPLEVPLCFTDIWVQIHGLQSGLMSESLAKQFGNFIGTFLEYDTSHLGHSYRSYMCIRVRIDVRIPLKRRKKIKISATSSFYANFRYERLPLFCFICGILGHGESLCPERLHNPELSPPYGWDSSLRIMPQRQSKPRSQWLRNDDGSPLIGSSSPNLFPPVSSSDGSDMDVNGNEDTPLLTTDGNKRQRTTNSQPPDVSRNTDSKDGSSNSLAGAGVRPSQSS